MTYDRDTTDYTHALLNGAVLHDLELFVDAECQLW